MSDSITMYQVDAFTQQVFGGNPAAVMIFDKWPQESLMRAMAMENNLSETAYLRPAKAHELNSFDYELRWFTPAAEVDLCGHATLASGHVLFQHVGVSQQTIRFKTRSGMLTVTQLASGMLELDFPATELTSVSVPTALIGGLGVEPQGVWLGFDYIAVMANEDEVRRLKPDMKALRQLPERGVVVTAKGTTHDFVSRCFFPKLEVNEDPVTGSAHCQLAPYWQAQLNRGNVLTGQQLSTRGGVIECEVIGSRVKLRGHAVTYMTATVHLAL
ncbi:MAG: PhzF family phenazine biosynthesis protein [Firmicutes bacterium]|nr:PhzF family phenazine biosynthesis protein [Bacillota bacterium]